jgi:hypothetical protein
MSSSYIGWYSFYFPTEHVTFFKSQQVISAIFSLNSALFFFYYLRVLSGHSNLGAWLGSFDPVHIINQRHSKVFYMIFMKESHERSIKTICSLLRIPGMALSKKTTSFFIPPAIYNLKLSHSVLPNPTNSEDDLPRLA